MHANRTKSMDVNSNTETQMVLGVSSQIKLADKFFWKLPLNVPFQTLFRQIPKKYVGHRARKRDVVDQSYPIYACTSAKHAQRSSIHVKFCGNWKHS